LKSEVNEKARDRETRSLHNPQNLVDLFEEAVSALFVDALDSFEDFESTPTVPARCTGA
jgi:hypothetical protein